MIYENSDEFFNHITKLAKSATLVDIVSFGMYIGFSKGRDWHSVYPVTARKFLESCPKEGTRLLLNMESYIPAECKSCATQDIIQRNRKDSFMIAISYLGIKQVRTICNSHAKMFRIDDDCFFGGINLGGSSSKDIAMIASRVQSRELREYFNKLWAQGKEVKPL
jgi:hypothetical protein